MKRHQSKYDDLYTKWQGGAWMDEFSTADAKIQAAIPRLQPGCKLAQPNPWADTDGVSTVSKRYLTRVLNLYGQEDGGPAAAVFAGCRRIAGLLGGDGSIVFEAGPMKDKVRVFEKSRMQEGRLDLIRDYARGQFKVNKLDAMPFLLGLLQVRLLPFRPVLSNEGKNRLCVLDRHYAGTA